MIAEAVPEKILAISELPDEFHPAGVLGKEVILKIFELSKGFSNIRSLETGCGKSTLLFSNISMQHHCFTLGEFRGGDDGSLKAVLESEYFNKQHVDLILGPSQQTLPCHEFKSELDIIFIDGPHGFPFPNLEYYYLYPQLAEGGLLIVDDIHIPTISQLHEFLKEDDMFTHIGIVSTTSFFRRTSSPLLDPLGDGWWLQKYNTKRITSYSKKYYGNNIKAVIYFKLVKYFGLAFAEKVRLGYKNIFSQKRH